jgi:hypothetical protein
MRDLIWLSHFQRSIVHNIVPVCTVGIFIISLIITVWLLFAVAAATTAVWSHDNARMCAFKSVAASAASSSSPLASLSSSSSAPVCMVGASSDRSTPKAIHNSDTYSLIPERAMLENCVSSKTRCEQNEKKILICYVGGVGYVQVASLERIFVLEALNCVLLASHPPTRPENKKVNKVGHWSRMKLLKMEVGNTSDTTVTTVAYSVKWQALDFLKSWMIIWWFFRWNKTDFLRYISFETDTVERGCQN